MNSFTSPLRFHTSGNGTPLLMIHGIISDHSFFDGSADLLSKNYTVITYDRRGYGENSAENYTDYSVHAQSEDAAGILRVTAEEPAFILGNSAGGLIGLELTLNHPELVKALILLEPSLGYDENDRQKLAAWNAELNEYVQSGRIKRALPAFSRMIGAPESQSGKASLQELRKTYQNLSSFLHGELNEVQHYLPDRDTLRTLKTPAVIAVTERNPQSVFATSAVSAAGILGWPLIHLPGYHNVAKDLPLDFAVSVHGIFSGIEQGYFSV